MKSKLLLAIVIIAAAGGIYYALSGTKTPPDDGPKVPVPAQLSVTLPPVNIYPHDTLSYTEGLEFYKGVLYESAGEYKNSFVATYDYKTGKRLSYKKLPDDIFGEGMTILNDKLYMLTWKNKKMFVLDPVTFAETGSFPWTLGDGWGMTNDGKSLIANTGGSSIFFLDPATLKIQRTISVTDEYGPVSNVNEMEYVNGVIYANIFETETIIKIDPKDGRVLARADLGSMYPEYNHVTDKARVGGGRLMNGIAYNPDTKTFLLTGKNWPKMFEVRMN